jgi:hypothetical protein
MPCTASRTCDLERGVAAKKPVRLALENRRKKIQHPLLIAAAGKCELPFLKER